ncbi:MAG: hypothetical protein EAX95_06575 [Candidatus Thorarchaeota archaeon]|nr:hypothetical protein [Candidatus Thorarchaeota archaeon]
MSQWKDVFQELMTEDKVFTVYLRYMQKDTLAKIPNVKVAQIYENHVKLENQSGFGILDFADILYISIPRRGVGQGV